MDGKLIHRPTGNEIKKGDIVTNFRGDKYVVRDWWTRPAPSTGRVLLKEVDSEWEHPYYPGTIDCEIVEGTYS